MNSDSQKHQQAPVISMMPYYMIPQTIPGQPTNIGGKTDQGAPQPLLYPFPQFTAYSFQNQVHLGQQPNNFQSMQPRFVQSLQSSNNSLYHHTSNSNNSLSILKQPNLSSLYGQTAPQSTTPSSSSLPQSNQSQQTENNDFEINLNEIGQTEYERLTERNQPTMIMNDLDLDFHILSDYLFSNENELNMIAAYSNDFGQQEAQQRQQQNEQFQGPPTMLFSNGFPSENKVTAVKNSVTPRGTARGKGKASNKTFAISPQPATETKKKASTGGKNKAVTPTPVIVSSEDGFEGHDSLQDLSDFDCK